MATKNDPNGTGFQGMAVAPVDENGNVDTSSVAIIAAGTESGNITDMHGAAEETTQGLSPQYEAAEDFYDEVTSEGYTVSQVSGYSQSAYMLKVGANHGVPATVFNGWFSYDSLTDAEKEYMYDHPEDYVNYRRKNDEVTKYNDAFHGAAEEEHGTVVWVDGSSHDIADWKFGKNGEVVDKNGNPVSVATLTKAYDQGLQKWKSTTLNPLKESFKSGGYSDHEMIYMDYAQATAVAEVLSAVAQTGHEIIVGHRDQAVKDAEELYNSLKKRPWSVDKLSDDEIAAIYAEYGLDYEGIVGNIKEHFDAKVKTSQTVTEKFTKLSSTIKTQLQTMEEADSGLAKDIAGWKSGTV
ncbi:hypothetical protein ACVR0S_03505 [Streptococcus dentapri]|uniref:Uncharacterized protein n=1 Tax=Streptococcus dentapri TaxID=573564 RepID=A0ABV8D2K9_9STRE